MPDLVGAASQRLEKVLTAAEESAAGILEDARLQARRYAQESRRRVDEVSRQRTERMGELVDSLLTQGEALREQGEMLRRQAESLTRAMSRAAQAIETELGGMEYEAAMAEPRDPRGRARGAQAQAGDHPFTRFLNNWRRRRPEGPGHESMPTEGVEVMAAQMHAAGLNADEIAQRLREDFDVEDVDVYLADERSRADSEA